LTTFKQAAIRRKTYKIKNFTRTPALCSRPQVKGTVVKIATMSPKKPNSASRQTAKIKLTNEFNVTARIPGKGYVCSKYNRVLVNGGRANDLPGVGYTLVRGAYDFSPVIFKKKRRSVYGTSRPDGYTKFTRRCFRTQKSS
jgi:small subunit ribosomal protein S12